MKKRWTALCLGLVMAASLALPAFGEKDIRVFVNGDQLTFDQSPVIQDDRTLVPMRGIFEALGAEVQWDSAEKSVFARWDTGSLSLKIGKKEIIMGSGERILLDVPAQIINDRTMVPLRAVSEAMDADVQWVKETREIYIERETMEYANLFYLMSGVAEPYFEERLNMMEYGNFSFYKATDNAGIELTFYNIERGDYDILTFEEQKEYLNGIEGLNILYEKENDFGYTFGYKYDESETNYLSTVIYFYGWEINSFGYYEDGYLQEFELLTETFFERLEKIGI